MNKGKLFSGLAALGIYLGLIFLVLYFYNIHKTKAKNYVEKNSNRVTVTLVNSDKTVFNKSSKISTPTKPKPIIIPPVHIKRPTSKKHVPPKIIPKKTRPKKHVPKKVVPKKVIPKKVIPKKHVPKKVVPKKVIPKKPIPKKHVPKKVVPKKVVPKKPIPKKHVPKKVVPKKVIPKKPIPKKHVPKKVVPKKTAKDLFSTVKTKDVTKRPVKREPKHVKKQPVVVPKSPSSIKHNSRMSDRIKNTHQSGRVSNANRDKGIQNAYVAKVKRHMNNWNAGSAHKGKHVSLALTIYSSGKFSYRILSGGDTDMKRSLSQFLDRLNRMGQLGRHSKSSPYSIRVDFTVR